MKAEKLTWSKLFVMVIWLCHFPNWSSFRTRTWQFCWWVCFDAEKCPLKQGVVGDPQLGDKKVTAWITWYYYLDFRGCLLHPRWLIGFLNRICLYRLEYVFSSIFAKRRVSCFFIIKLHHCLTWEAASLRKLKPRCDFERLSRKRDAAIDLKGKKQPTETGPS